MTETANTSDYQPGKVEIEALATHPNADRLEIAVLTRKGLPFHYQVVVAKGQYQPGDSAFYVPVSTQISGDHPELAFLSPSERACLRAKRLRGVYSEGLLVPMADIRSIGIRTGGQLPFTRYVSKARIHFGQQDCGPKGLDVPVYGVENLRHGRALEVMDPSTEIEVTEKIHGMNIRFVVHEGKLYVGSHRTWRKGLDNAWGRALLCCAGPVRDEITPEDEARLAAWVKDSAGEGAVIYGEVYGHGAQDLAYDHLGGPLALRVFDVWGCKSGAFVTMDVVARTCERFGSFGSHDCLETVPVLYRGPISGLPASIQAMAEGPTLLGGKHVREGVVVKTADGVFRGKWVGEGYKLRKHQTDNTDG